MQFIRPAFIIGKFQQSFLMLLIRNPKQVERFFAECIIK